MELVLNNGDLEFLDSLIKKTPFEYAQPLFQFFTSRIQEQQARAAQDTEAKVPIEEATAKVEAPKNKLKKA